MKISNDFPILQKENALMIVSGKQAGKIYRLRNGKLVERESLEISTPTYSDNEGFFMRRGNGRTMGTGSVLEIDSQLVITEYTKQLAKELKSIKRPYDGIYLFVPKYVSNAVKDALPKTVQKKILREFNGNFIKEHPSELLQKIKNQRDKAVKKKSRELVGGDAAKILRRGRRVMVGNDKKVG